MGRFYGIRNYRERAGHHPKAIRELLRLKPGDRVKFFILPDDSVLFLPKLPAAVLKGIVKGRRRSVTIAEMNLAGAVSRRKRR
ncbi:MAG TPA: hypothetical protein VF772_12570 [Terriglobales bacterium]